MTVAEHHVYYLEIVTNDLEGTRDLFAATHGWTFSPPDAGLGNALIAKRGDGSMCGLRAPLSEQETPIVRTYLLVDDIDAVVSSADKNGATIALPPTPVGDHGRVAIYFIGGIEQGVWELP